MLPSRFPKARILTYNWRADTFRNAADDYLHGHAEHMLSSLQEEVGHRPLIFIGSCFGGLLLAEALISDLLTTAMKESIVGIITLGTPFKGTRAATAAQIRVKLAETFGGEVSEKLLEVLRGDQSSFDKTVERFARLVHDKNRNLALKCFYETEKSDIYGRHLRLLHLPASVCRFLGAKPIVLVEKSSACIDGLEPYQVNVKHLMMNKFQNAQDPTFGGICDTIDEFLLGTKRQQQIDEARVWLASQDNKQCSEILQQRPAQIEPCHSDTFEWLLVDDAHGFNKDGHWSTTFSHARAVFQEWLVGKSNFFWIHGKAGSGKSTMMKKLAAHHKTKEMLSRGSDELVIIFHSFWRPGHLIQKSFLGLLLTIVFALADNNEEMVAEFLSANKQLRKTSIFDWPSNCLSQLSLQLIDLKPPAAETILFFDGLDEIDQERDKDSLMNYLQRLRCRESVKICVSSRYEKPWIEGSDQFEIGRAQFRLETLNELDIRKYVSTEAQKASAHIRNLYATEESFGELVDDITYRAEGVFLGAVLVVENLRKTAAGATTQEIQKRVSNMPKGLINLYSHLLGKLEEDEHVVTEAASYLELVHDLTQRFRMSGNHLPHATLLRQRRFAENDGVDPTRANFARNCAITMSRVRDICVGMIQFEADGPCSFETEAQLESMLSDSPTSSTDIESSTFRSLYEFWNVSMRFLNRSVSDFLDDHPEGQKLMEKSETDDVDIFNSFVDSGVMYLRLDVVRLTSDNPSENPSESPPEGRKDRLRTCLHDICYWEAAKLAGKIRSVAMRRLICSINASRLHTDTLAVDDGDWLQADLTAWNALLEGDRLRGPAIDGPGYALARGYSDFFDEEIVQYLQPSAAEGCGLSFGYKNYLLMCAIHGKIAHAALKLVHAGASLHTPTPAWLGGPWVRSPADELLLPIGEDYIDWFGSGWRQLMHEAHTESRYSVLSLSMASFELADGVEFPRSTPIGIFIDYTIFCELIQACVHDRFETTYEGAHISDLDKHVGFAINATTNAFVPIRAGFFKLYDWQCIEVKSGNFRKSIREEGYWNRLTSEYAAWLSDWDETLCDSSYRGSPQSTLAEQALKHGLLWDDWEVKTADYEARERLKAEKEAQKEARRRAKGDNEARALMDERALAGHRDSGVVPHYSTGVRVEIPMWSTRRIATAPPLRTNPQDKIVSETWDAATGRA